jgi:hypothetical protein
MCTSIYPKELIDENSLAKLECIIDFLDKPDVKYEGLYRIQKRMLFLMKYLPKTVNKLFYKDLGLTVFSPKRDGTETWTYIEAREYVKNEFLGGKN